MTLLKVKLYRDARNRPEGMPEAWPAETDLLQSGEKVEVPWIEMSAEEFAAYCEKHRKAYAEYQAKYDPKGLKAAPSARKSSFLRRLFQMIGGKHVA